VRFLRVLWRLAALALFTAAAFPQTAPDAVVLVAGSVSGEFGTSFRTRLQLSNRGDSPASGWLVFHPDGRPGSDSDPRVRFELAARATVAFADLSTAFGQDGIGSVDILVEKGSVPAVTARIFDSGNPRRSGVIIPAVDPATALSGGDQATLIVPADLERSRFNIGIRTLEEETVIDILVRDRSGALRSLLGQVIYPPHYFEQRRGDIFTQTRLAAGETVTIRVRRGRLFLYGTSVDNISNDTTIQKAAAWSRLP